MKKLMSAGLVLSLLGQGCATVFKGNYSDVEFASYPPGARLVIDGFDRGNTPARFSMESGRNHYISFLKDGYREQSFYLQSTVNPGWVILDIFPGFLLGFIPVLVDAITGAWSDLTPGGVSVILPPLPAAPPARTSATPSPPEE